jgi:N-6 DNA Methylase.
VAFRHSHLDGDEKGEAQTFLDRLFKAFGHDGVIEAGGKFEKRLRKAGSKTTSFADLVWKPRLLLEMKKAGEPLAKHYQQAFEYWIAAVPVRPDYVVLCNFDEFWIYDLDQQLDDPMDKITIDDLPKRWEALAFLLPEPVTPVFHNDLVAVTREAAATVVAMTNHLIARGTDRAHAQHFTTQCVMAMFAEDVGLLPQHVFTRAIEDSASGGNAYDLLFGLFREMNTTEITPAGRYKDTPYFNGGLFRDVNPFDLDIQELHALHTAAQFDWAEVRPEIFGTLFEQSLGKEERHAYGAHFTSPTDIQRVVLPTIVRPWRTAIEEAQNAKELAALEDRLLTYRVLDPACGCGNFLYIAYRELRKIEKELHDKRGQLRRSAKPAAGGTARMSFVQPGQFFGLDINNFAVEIAKLTMMLAKQLAAAEQGDEHQVLPLDDLDANFTAGDALFMDWPKADAIIGNPPYLGRRKLVEERGASYSAQLAEAYPDVAGVADYVVYWFRNAQDELPDGGRAGLVGTKTIRETHSRTASLDYVVDRGGTIIDAWSSIPWSGDAVVHVSIVNWIKGGSDEDKVLWLDDGERRVVMPTITGSLAEELDLRSALDLKCNQKPKVFFQGQTPGHTKGFVLTPGETAAMRAQDPKSADVLYPYIIGDELLHAGEPTRWVIDFDAPDSSTAQAMAPLAFDRLHKLVLSDRQAKADKEATDNAEVAAERPNARLNWHHRNFLNRWWQHSYRREDLLAAIAPLDRYVVISRVASERRGPVFTFVDRTIRPSDAIQCFAFDDDYTFGVLHSAAHAAWFRGRCSRLKADLRYTASTVFDTFPWPQEPTQKAVDAIVNAVEEIINVRLARLRIDVSLAKQYDRLREPGNDALRDAHDKLDAAVLAAYGFDTSTDVLAQLLDLNHLLAEREKQALPVRGPGAHGLGAVRKTDYRVETAHS